MNIKKRPENTQRVLNKTKLKIALRESITYHKLLNTNRLLVAQLIFDFIDDETATEESFSKKIHTLSTKITSKDLGLIISVKEEYYQLCDNRTRESQDRLIKRVNSIVERTTRMLIPPRFLYTC